MNTMHRILLVLVTLLCAAGCATGPGIGNPENMTATLCIAPGVDAEAVQDAAEAWNVASNGRVNLTLVMGTECDTVIDAVTPHDDTGKEACGETLMDGSRIHIAPQYCAANMGRKVNTIEHELGHFLTGPNHSTNKDDIMWHSNSDVVMPTAADVARLPQ